MGVSDAMPRSGPPLDFSFKEIGKMEDALFEESESGFPKNPANVHIDLENPDASPSPAVLAPRPKVQLNTVAIRLGNNKLKNLNGLRDFLSHVMDDPDSLMWLDLSCNQLTGIDDVLLTFPNLQVLYLHGNSLSNLSDIAKLQKLPKLNKLTLHGNHLSPLYRLFTTGKLPQLKSLDFGTITNVDRDKISIWCRGHQKRIESRS